MSHIDHLLIHIPDLAERRILDIGSGRGDFLIDATLRGFSAEGVEYNSAYITLAHERAKENHVSITVREGKGEKLPYQDQLFDFINVAEVIEHVQEPEAVISEIKRVLAPGGIVYISVPNRFGWYDPHFHLYFVNWLPRKWSELYIRLFKKQKDYAQVEAGHQKLSDMHYMTRAQFEKLCCKYNLTFSDSREIKLTKLPFSAILIPLYQVLSFLFIPTFHGFVEFSLK